MKTGIREIMVICILHRQWKRTYEIINTAFELPMKYVKRNPNKT